MTDLVLSTATSHIDLAVDRASVHPFHLQRGNTHVSRFSEVAFTTLRNTPSTQTPLLPLAQIALLAPLEAWNAVSTEMQPVWNGPRPEAESFVNAIAHTFPANSMRRSDHDLAAAPGC